MGSDPLDQEVDVVVDAEDLRLVPVRPEGRADLVDDDVVLCGPLFLEVREHGHAHLAGLMLFFGAHAGVPSRPIAHVFTFSVGFRYASPRAPLTRHATGAWKATIG